MEYRRVTRRLFALIAAVIIGAAATAFLAAEADGGQRRVVSHDRGRHQIGLASFYGPGFHGEETASGETFDQREMVAAHRTLPLGSVVRVTNLENGRSVVVRVIDRGPYGQNYRNGTIIDVSKGAARRLRFIRDGLVRVRVEVLERGDNERK